MDRASERTAATPCLPPDSRPFSRYAYPPAPGGRDLRFDFMRGFAMLSVVAAHLEMFSWFNFVFWERLGLISAAELFVVTAGLVLGLVNRRVVERDGIGAATTKLLRRSFVLYRALIVTVFLLIVLARSGLLDMTALTTFTDRFAGQVYPMIPAAEEPLTDQIARVMAMRASPHQIQILGLYVILIAIVPIGLWLLDRRLIGLYFALSWVLYFAGWLTPPDTPLLGMQFEYAFPPMMYQVLFTHALAVGYFRAEIAAWLKDAGRRRVVVAAAAALALGFLLFAQATANPSFPAWSRVGVVSPETFQAVYDVHFVKKHPGLLRLTNVAVFFVTLYALLTYFWTPIDRAIGWLLIPLGEASLYVFLMHLLFIVIIDQLPGYFDVVPAFADVWPGRIWINSAFYVATILSLWLLVRNRVLFSIIPR